MGDDALRSELGHGRFLGCGKRARSRSFEDFWMSQTKGGRKVCRYESCQVSTGEVRGVVGATIR
jgi:hypothetical protein